MTFLHRRDFPPARWIFSSRQTPPSHYERNYRARLLPISICWNFHEITTPTRNERFYFPYRSSRRSFFPTPISSSLAARWTRFRAILHDFPSPFSCNWFWKTNSYAGRKILRECQWLLLVPTATPRYYSFSVYLKTVKRNNIVLAWLW